MTRDEYDKIRKGAHMKFVEVAESIGISEYTLHRFVSGKTKMRADRTLAFLSAALESIERERKKMSETIELIQHVEQKLPKYMKLNRKIENEEK